MATKTISWNTGSGNITLTYQGQGNGTISVASDANDIRSARSQVIEVQTLDGAITREFTVNQAACPFPVGDVRNYSYTGSYQEVELPAGQYKFQVWGAQGGQCSDGYSGGKGGYSEGVITLASKTTVRVYVGGQGSYNDGGFNGGGSTTGSSSYNSDNTYGISSMGGGGGATDIRLSDGSLLSRMIVAGGGSGGAYCYKEETQQVTTWSTVYYGSFLSEWSNSLAWSDIYVSSMRIESFIEPGETYKFTISGKSVTPYAVNVTYWNGTSNVYSDEFGGTTSGTFVVWSGTYDKVFFDVYARDSSYSGSITIELQETTSQTVTDSNYQYGYAGGGTNGAGYSSSYYGKQNGAGSGGSFGQGANQTITNYRFCSGAGGGGWYGGGGGQYSDNDMNTVHLSGGGSGFVNTAASAGNRPSGYTGLELDSGTLYAGNQSFPAPGGGNETGHSGNGYARITRLS